VTTWIKLKIASVICHRIKNDMIHMKEQLAKELVENEHAAYVQEIWRAKIGMKSVHVHERFQSKMRY
jgi:hypothetical protein